MAQSVTVTLEDDLDGSPADETVLFAFAGVEYEIDLSTKNATAFRSKLAPFLETRPQDRARAGAPPGPHGGKSSAQRRYPGLGQRPRHRGQ